MGEVLRCGKCQSDQFTVKKYIFKNNTQHVGAICSKCETHLQWLPANEELTLTKLCDIEIPFGQYKGVKLKDVPESYLIWCKENTGGSLKNKIISYLQEISLEKS